MIVKCVEHGVATVLITREEATALIRTITIARLQVGEDAVSGNPNISIEHLRTVLSSIAMAKEKL